MLGVGFKPTKDQPVLRLPPQCAEAYGDGGGGGGGGGETTSSTRLDSFTALTFLPSMQIET